MKSYLIYSLSSSESPDDVRYIGQTIKSLNDRLIMHMYKAKKETNHRACWIRSEVKKGNKILINFIEEAYEDTWSEREIEIIAEYKARGFSLVNTCIGGKCTMLGRKHSTESIAKISKALSGKKRKSPSKETRDKIRKGVIEYQKVHGHPKGMKGKTHTEEAILKMIINSGRKPKPKAK